MQNVNLYGEDGITIGLTGDYDICQINDPECEMTVTGYQMYADTAEGARRSIRAEYMHRQGMVWHSGEGWIPREYAAKLAEMDAAQ